MAAHTFVPLTGMRFFGAITIVTCGPQTVVALVLVSSEVIVFNASQKLLCENLETHFTAAKTQYQFVLSTNFMPVRLVSNL